MKIQENHSLAGLNTFGVSETAKYFTSITSVEELKEVLASDIFQQNPWMMLGGGSNVLFTKPYDGLIILNQIKGIELVKEDESNVFLKVGAGEVWHEVVLHTLANGWFGMENMSLIPGSVGASPIQNIGAYGMELKDVFESLEAVEVATGKLKTFTHEECAFGYRDSFFKRAGKGKFIITSVCLKLNKSAQINVSYGAIQQVLEEKGITEITPKAVSDAVIEIRQSKLPDPKEIGNGGSFFKNPVIEEDQYLDLKEEFPRLSGYPAGKGFVKIPAGFLIDQAGWKGYRKGNVGVHEKQALVLVNFGGNNGQAIIDLAKEIQASVMEKFGVEIQPEVNIIG
ncbi:UDP-N-acetylmuramate dehydrogenase [Persicobacter psychrovividus]|uniref:UDP-N-acetylenolpyruvoylglucosamine reductase n=1 Tax=Persicobacter psychrovividus TaxID=387638 RepID=A0ABM7VFT2_9BACT|nr:UDP-N-acetylenolpyruvoylglucosamine reductase [Persicobacter psychrovividus]